MTSLPTRAQANVELPAFDARHNSFCRQITVQIQPVGVPSDNHRQGKPERVVLDDFDFVPRESGINLSRAEFISTTAGLVECCIEPLDTSRRSVAIRRSIQCFDQAENRPSYWIIPWTRLSSVWRTPPTIALYVRCSIVKGFRRRMYPLNGLLTSMLPLLRKPASRDA